MTKQHAADEPPPSVPVRLPKSNAMPTDRFRFMYFVMMFLGIGTLWPYNMIISSSTYFEKRYPSINTSNIIPTIMQYPSIIVLFLMIRYGDKASFSTRLAICCPLIAASLAVIPAIASADASWSFPVLAVVILLLGICVAVIQSTSLSLASKFPPIYVQSVMTGQGIAGVCVCVVLLLIKYIMSKANGQSEGYVLFIYLSAFVPLIALVLYVGGRQSAYSAFVLRRRKSSISSMSRPGSDVADLLVDHRAVIGKITMNGLLIALVFVGTFLMFPGLTVALTGASIPQDWFPLLLVTTFNVFDTFGRFAAGFVSVQSAPMLWAAVAARFALYPLFVLHKAGMFVGGAGDVLAFVLEAVLALSNGYLASAIMMRTSSLVEQHEEEASSAAMAFFLMTGILVGLNMALLLHIAVPGYL